MNTQHKTDLRFVWINPPSINGLDLISNVIKGFGIDARFIAEFFLETNDEYLPKGKYVFFECKNDTSGRKLAKMAVGSRLEIFPWNPLLILGGVELFPAELVDMYPMDTSEEEMEYASDMKIYIDERNKQQGTKILFVWNDAPLMFNDPKIFYDVLQDQHGLDVEFAQFFETIPFMEEEYEHLGGMNCVLFYAKDSSQAKDLALFAVEADGKMDIYDWFVDAQGKNIFPASILEKYPPAHIDAEDRVLYEHFQTLGKLLAALTNGTNVHMRVVKLDGGRMGSTDILKAILEQMKRIEDNPEDESDLN